MIAPAHIAQGSSVTHSSQPVSRSSPRCAAAARIAAISACAVGSWSPARSIAALADHRAILDHDRADRHFAVRRRLARQGKRALHRFGERPL